jgi:pimeloyl-ACP methyl ester carboxylesterase
MKAIYLPDEPAFLRYLEVPGDGPPILWLHGWQCSSTAELLPVAVQAPLRGRNSLLIDFLGHGYSDKPADFGYRLEDHARTIVTFIDALGISKCSLVGHSMGGAIATLVAAARPDVVTLLVMAEGAMGRGDMSFADQSEDEFVDHGYAALIEGQAQAGEADHGSVPAIHVGMTRLVDPRALYREDVSLAAGTYPSILSLLGSLPIPRWYLEGEFTEPEPEFEREIAAAGVGWKAIANAGHPMGLQNPQGVAQAVADVLD